MTPYVPSGRTDPAGLTAALLLAAVAGTILGAVAHEVGGVARPVLIFGVFPLAMGSAAGVVARFAVAHWHVRSPRLAAVTGAFGALLACVTEAGVSYARNREDYERQLRSHSALGRVNRVDVGFGLTRWTLELAIALTAGAVLTYRSAAVPFCETCGEWFPSRAGAISLGGVDRFDDACKALHADDGARLGALAASANPDAEPHLSLRVRRCATCADGPWFAELVQSTTTHQGVETLVGLDGLLDPAVVAVIEATRGNGRAPPPASAS